MIKKIMYDHDITELEITTSVTTFFYYKMLFAYNTDRLRCEMIDLKKVLDDAKLDTLINGNRKDG